jgi:tetratricopeptide (TPR) repeat protein
MASGSQKTANTGEIDRLALALAKEPGSKAFIPLAEEYGKAGMWEEAAAVLEDGLKAYPSFITAMVALGRAYDQMNQPVKAKAILEEAVKLSPENLRAHRTLAKIYAAQGAKAEALWSCNVILSVNPQDQEALSLRTILGEPVAQPQSAQPKPSGKNQPSKPTEESADRSGGHAHARPIPASAYAPAAVSSEIPEEGPATGMSAGQQTAHNPKRAVAAQLTQWLTSIQARRRDAVPPPDQKLQLPK